MSAGRRSGCLEHWQLDAGSLKGDNNDIPPSVPLRAMQYSHVGTFRYCDVNGNQHDDEMVWWEALLDRMKDHAMASYLGAVKK
jgi:hypothetical protein